MSVIPRIISVDDHVIEPADVWTSRLPAAYVERAPRIHIAPKGEMTLVEGAWVEAPGDGDEMAAWWHFEGRRYQIKRMVACPGMPPEEVTMEGVTYDMDVARQTEVRDCRRCFVLLLGALMTLSEIRLLQSVRVAVDPAAFAMKVMCLYLQGPGETPTAACEWRKGAQLVHYPVEELEPA